MKKRILSFLLALLMVVSIFPMPTHAEHTGDESETPTSAPTEAPSEKPSENPSENPTSYIAVMADLDNPCCTMDNGSHDATCANYICPACGTGPWHEVCPTIEEPPTEEPTEPEKHPDLGKMVKFNGSWPWAYKSPTNFNDGKQLNVAKFPKVMRVVEVHEVGTSVIYKLETGDGSSWPEADDGYFYIESTKVTAAVKCSNCSEYECGIDHSATEPTAPENPCECGCETCTGAEGCECKCGNCNFCEKEPENTCDCGCETCTGAEGCECKCGNCNFCEKEPENICGCCESCTGAEGCECECGECAFCEKTEEPTVPSISATVVDSNGNEQTVTVSGEALPEGAELVVTPVDNEADIIQEMGWNISYLWDIKVLDANHNIWQPAHGETVLITLPIAVENSYATVFHFLDDPEAIGTLLKSDAIIDILPMEDFEIADYMTKYSCLFASEIAAYRAAKGTDDEAIAVEVIPNIQVSNGVATFEISSFSIFSSKTYSSKTDYDDKDNRILIKDWNPTTYYVTAGEKVYFDNKITGATAKQWSVTGPSSAIDFYYWAGKHRCRLTINSDAKEGEKVVVKYVRNNGDTFTSTLIVVKEYSINYNANGGTVNGSTSYTQNLITNDTGFTGLLKPEREGYVFLGWFTSTTGNSQVTTWNGKQNLTLYAQWSYDVNYSLNGGSGDSSKQTINANNTIALHAAPSRSGYTFLGWYSTADGAIYSGGATYSAKKPTTMTALWGKQSNATSGWNKNFYILPGTTSHNFTAALKYIDKDKISQDGSQNNITGDNNTYYIAPGATVALAHDSGMWRIDGAKNGLTLKAGSETANATGWTAAATNATLTVSATAEEGTTMMIYVRDAAAPAEVSCARIIVDKVSDITAAATNDTQGIYRLGIFVLGDSSKIPGEPNYTIDVSMISWNDGDGMAYKSSAKGLIEELIGTSAHYESSQDGSCTMGIVDYEGFETGEHMSDQLIKDAMSTLILAVEKGYNMIAADGTKLLEFYNQHGGGKAGADAIKANFSVRPYVVKLMTALPAVDLGWHVDLAVYAKNTVMVNYNLNIPQGYVVKTLGTPAPGIGQSLTGDASVKITEAITLDTPHTATVTGATDTVNLIFKGWNTKPDGTGTSYAPGSTISLSESVTLYAQWWTDGSFATGTLEIHKRVKVAANSQQPNANDTFTFSPGLEGSWSYAVYNETTGVQLRTGTMTNGTVTLKAGEFVRFVSVPIGKYTVKETNLPADYTAEEASYTVNLKGGYVNQAIFTNTYEKTLTYTMTGVINHGTVSDPVTVDCGEEAKLSFTPHEGYEMTGWRVSTESEDQIFTTPDTNTWTYEIAELKHNVTVTVYTRPIKYSISYELNDGELAAGVTNPESYTIETETFTLNKPTRDGYKFKGWATSENATSGTETETIAKGTTGNKTYYALWERSLVDLTITATTDDVNQNFIFTVSGTRSDGVEFKPIEVVLCNDNNFQVTIKDLPVGFYTVTENNDWSWRENAVESKTADLRTTSQTVSFDFYVVDDLHWLSGYSYNKRKKGGS